MMVMKDSHVRLALTELCGHSLIVPNTTIAPVMEHATTVPASVSKASEAEHAATPILGLKGTSKASRQEKLSRPQIAMLFVWPEGL